MRSVVVLVACVIACALSGCALFEAAEEIDSSDAGIVDAGGTEDANGSSDASVGTDAATTDDAERPDASVDAGIDASVDAGTDAGNLGPQLLFYMSCELPPDAVIVEDESGAGNHAECVGECPSTVVGLVGRTCVFDGATGHLEIPHAPEFDMAEGFSIMALAKAQNTSGRSIMAKPYGSENRNSWQFYLSDSNVDRLIFVANALEPTDGTAPLAPFVPNTWYHVAMTVGPQGRRTTYVDGQFFEADSTMTAVDDNPIFIGADANAGQVVFPFVGEIDEVRIYRGVVSEEEVRRLGTIPAQ